MGTGIRISNESADVKVENCYVVFEFTVDQLKAHDADIRRGALEEAAKVCDQQVAVYVWKLQTFVADEDDERIERTEAYKEAVERMAEAILALKEKS